jgi:phenylacetate-coenzyme A ligase PaaK-like adenylate-forming protein
MGVKSLAAKLFAKYVYFQTKSWASKPKESQEKVFKQLIKSAQKTVFGKDHNFDLIQNFTDFAAQVPVRDYEDLKPYINQILDGKDDVLWPAKPIYFAKTSGTTSGAKYIPITKVSIAEQVKASRNAILSYIHETGKAEFVTKKMIFLQGSPVLEQKNGIQMGRLSGISAHYVPKYLQKNRLPSWETNCIEDWETKVSAIVDETINHDMGVIAGIPSWVQMYFEKIENVAGKKVGEVFKNFNLFIYGGVNYEPYRSKFENLIGRKVDSIELFPASEGFFAYQDKQDQAGMLLLLNAGIFYEFIKVEEFETENPKAYTISQVELNTNYVLIISTNAGLWRYNIGDTVSFTSLLPYRIVVTGRIKHFISAFGEHVIGKEVETALNQAMENTNIRINEFTVAPQINPRQGLPYHEWLIEFENEPEDLTIFAETIDTAMRKQNVYYDDLIVGNILQKAVITKVNQNGFQNYMKSIGKLGGQNKIPRLANDRSIADQLTQQIN